MRKTLLLAIFGLLTFGFRPFWGFFAHEKINRLAVFTLPPDLIGFYKKNIHHITDGAVTPDKRRYAVSDEAPRHYLDLDHYADSTFGLPHDWKEAVRKFTEDTLKAYGILPWHIHTMYHRLTDAFMLKDPARILTVSAELGHYIGDAHVPLHTTENYNGQLTGQEGIHGFWESRLPEIFFYEYDFFVGQAEYIPDPRKASWNAITSSHALLERVLADEKKLAAQYAEKKFAFENRGNVTVKVFASEYAADYHRMLDGMVEKQMRAAIKMTGDFWFTAWVDAGQPEMKRLIDYKPTEEQLKKNREAVEAWKKRSLRVRGHE